MNTSVVGIGAGSAEILILKVRICVHLQTSTELWQIWPKQIHESHKKLKLKQSKTAQWVTSRQKLTISLQETLCPSVFLSLNLYKSCQNLNKYINITPTSGQKEKAKIPPIISMRRTKTKKYLYWKKELHISFVFSQKCKTIMCITV